MLGMLGGTSSARPEDDGESTLAVPGTGVGRMPAVKLRTFDGSRDPEVYREWRREVELVQLLYGLPPEQLGPLVYLSLESGDGKPRGMLAHMGVEELTSKTGLATILSTLDAEFSPVAYEAADVAFQRYNSCRRKHGEDMLTYISRLRSAKRQLEAQDPGTSFSTTNYAQKLLRSSGLSKLEQRQVLASAGACWDAEKISAALRLLFDDCQNDDRSRGFLRPGGGSKGSPPGDRPRYKQFPGTSRPKGDGKGKGYGGYGGL